MPPDSSTSDSKAIEKARALLETMRDPFRTSYAIQAGIHPRTLHAMVERGIIDRLGRGLYRIADGPSMGNPDLVAVGLKVPKGVVCLISALSFHEMTLEIPRAVYLALPRGTEPPRVDFPPLRIYWFTGAAFEEGIDEYEMDGVRIRIYNPEKTLADCFKYRNKIGLDVVLEALKRYRHGERFKIDDLMHFARVCRVERVMRPYLEAML
jgi:predicted transcriptional regulator of viral defense system